MEYRQTPMFDNKIIVRVLAVGNIDLYSTIDANGREQFFYKKEKNQELKNLDINSFLFGMSKKKAMAFFDDCPDLVEKIKKKEFEDNSVKELVLFYNKNCHTL
jgi:hypothetical protein